MKDMRGKDIAVGDFVRVHIHGADPIYHPVGKIIYMKKLLKRVQLRWLSDGSVGPFTYQSKEVAKVELEDLI